MQELLALILKYGTHLVFIILQIFCFYLIINYNDVQRSIFINSTSLYSSKVNARVDKLASYLDLQKANDSLQLENKRLLEQIIQSRIITSIPETSTIEDSAQQYQLLPVTVCNKTIHLRNNSITLCQGSTDGIYPLMGIITDNGIVGIVKETSEHYAQVITVLHSQSRISCEIAGKYSFGNLRWDGRDPLEASLRGVPRHTSISIGDTVMTSGYSAVFPPGHLVGTVAAFSIPRGSNEYDITVHLANDVTTTAYAFAVDNALRQEQATVEDED